MRDFLAGCALTLLVTQGLVRIWIENRNLKRQEKEDERHHEIMRRIWRLKVWIRQRQESGECRNCEDDDCDCGLCRLADVRLAVESPDDQKKRIDRMA